MSLKHSTCDVAEGTDLGRFDLNQSPRLRFRFLRTPCEGRRPEGRSVSDPEPGQKVVPRPCRLKVPFGLGWGGLRNHQNLSRRAGHCRGWSSLEGPRPCLYFVPAYCSGSSHLVVLEGKGIEKVLGWHVRSRLDLESMSSEMD